MSCNLLVFDSLVVSECTVENCVLQNFGQEYYSGELTWLLKMTIEIVDFPIKNGGSFQFVMLVYQRVPLENMLLFLGAAIPMGLH